MKLFRMEDVIFLFYENKVIDKSLYYVFMLENIKIVSLICLIQISSLIKKN